MAGATVFGVLDARVSIDVAHRHLGSSDIAMSPKLLLSVLLPLLLPLQH